MTAEALPTTVKCRFCAEQVARDDLLHHIAEVDFRYRPHGCNGCDMTSHDVEKMLQHYRTEKHAVVIGKAFDSVKEDSVELYHRLSLGDGAQNRVVPPQIPQQAPVQNAAPIDQTFDDGLNLDFDGPIDVGNAAEIPIPPVVGRSGRGVRKTSLRQLHQPPPVPSTSTTLSAHFFAQSTSAPQRAAAPARQFTACRLCGEKVGSEYADHREHTYRRHRPAGDVRGKEAQLRLKKAVKACFPSAKILNDKMCNECGLEVTNGNNTYHIQAAHLNRVLQCPLEGCNRNKSANTREKLKKHLKTVHNLTIGQLPPDLLDRYRAVTDEVRRESDSLYKKCFPFRMGRGIPRRSATNSDAGSSTAAEAALNVIQIGSGGDAARKTRGRGVVIKLEEPGSYEMLDE